MRIHSRTLTAEDLEAAARRAGVKLHAATPHRSRSHGNAFEVALSGSGKQGGQYGTTAYKTASWDEWGMALAHLFAIDPEASVPRTYLDAEDFHYKTDFRYRDLKPEDQHLRHKWTYVGPYERECTCGAFLRLK